MNLSTFFKLINLILVKMFRKYNNLGYIFIFYVLPLLHDVRYTHISTMYLYRSVYQNLPTSNIIDEGI